MGARHVTGVGVTGVGDMLTPLVPSAGISNAKVGSYCKVTDAEAWELYRARAGAWRRSSP